MKLKTTIAFILFLSLFNLVPAQQSDELTSPLFLIDSLYVPSGSGSTTGNGVFIGPLGNTPRTYQLLIHESELTSLVGLDLTAISLRLGPAASAAWPAAETVYQNYDIYLSGSVAPADRSFTFALNIVGTQTKVRSGSLTIAAGSYPFGGSPNLCGKEINFDTTWLYTGGHLLIEIRHDGSNSTSSSVDARTTSSAGYGSNFSAAWVGSYTGTTGVQGNFAIVRLSAADPVPVELTSFSAIANENNIVLKWTTATESNNSGFQVEKFSDNNWNSIGFIEGKGTTTEYSEYSFTDRNLKPGNYIYRLKQIDFDGTVSYSKDVQAEVTSPSVYSLEQNYPNPFNPSTTINFSVKEKANITITLFNTLGEKVAVLLNEDKEAGFYNLTFNASDLPGGTYFYEMRGGNFIQAKKMILLK